MSFYATDIKEYGRDMKGVLKTGNKLYPANVCGRCGGFIYRDIYGTKHCLNCGNQPGPDFAAEKEEAGEVLKENMIRILMLNNRRHK